MTTGTVPTTFPVGDERVDAPTPLRIAPPAPSAEAVARALAGARDWLLARQDARGFWCGELEGDTTLESYLILIEAFFGRLSTAKTDGLARTIRGEALPDGGWPQYAGGPPDLSVSCLSYFALKVAGDDAAAPHMRAARAAIARLGGAGRANSYTRHHFALFGQVPWDDVPAIPPEMMFLPGRAPFSVYDMSSWSRTIFVPLSILYGKRAVCPVPPERGVSELLRDAAAAGAPPPPPTRTRLWAALFESGDRAVKRAERLPGSAHVRRVALERAAAWMIERLAASDGLSAILPAMANSVLALKVLGYAETDPLLRENLGHLDDLILSDGGNDAGELRVQPCVSPVWDTVLASYALSWADLPPDHDALARAAAWLVEKQTRVPGDWARRNPAPPGGWFFEHRNPFYPDVDDTCMALMVLRRARAGGVDARAQEACVERGLAWMLGMQNDDGGFASFDRGNDKEWLTHIPFADHNAMIDPSTADITGRVLECLAHFPTYGGGPGASPVVARAVEFLKRDQETDGSWYGRWGVNHIYGTWQALRGLAAVGEDRESPCVRRAVSWLQSRQNADGGWGESIASYTDPEQRGVGASTPSQTAWAVMGLVAGAGPHDRAVERGVHWLIERQDAAGTWEQALWTGTGFPKVFYLNYHLYRHTFPLMALAQYRAARAEE
jgi:squalene-hopene/tetraprenyl-beta-curcumene cyclase